MWTRVVSYNPTAKLVIVLIAVIHWTISRKWNLTTLQKPLQQVRPSIVAIAVFDSVKVAGEIEAHNTLIFFI